ncbi:MAG: addiction module protein [Gammaproteobacteria bacterium]
MTEQTRILLEQARRLSAIDRAALVDELLSSLDQPDEAVQAQWAEEAERRLAAYDRGEIQAIDVDEAFPRLHKKQT